MSIIFIYLYLINTNREIYKNHDLQLQIQYWHFNTFFLIGNNSDKYECDAIIEGLYIYKCTNISFSTYIYIIFRRDLSLARRCCYCFDFQFFPWNQISRNFEIIFNPELGVEWILSNCSFLMPHLQQKQLKIQFLHQCWRVDLDPHCCVRKKNGKTIQKHDLIWFNTSTKITKELCDICYSIM